MVYILEYSETLKMIDEIGADSVKTEVNTIDLTLLFSSKAEQRAKIKFKQLLAIATDMEALPLQAQQKPVQAQTAKPAQAQAQPEGVGAAQASFSALAPVRQEQPQQPQPVQAPQAPTHELSAAKRELEGLVKGLGTGLSAALVRHPSIKQKEGENVLSKLSLADQVAELERIIEGLNEHAFNNEQLGIIRKEALGLKKSLQKGAPKRGPGIRSNP